MNGEPQKSASNLEFFQAAILHPAIDQRRQAHLSKTDRGMSSFGPVEAAHWARLGVLIGYLDAKDAHALIASTTEVIGSWSELQAYDLVAPHEIWAQIIDPRSGDQPLINSRLFEPATETAPVVTEMLHSTYQTYLLLTAQNNFDDDTYYFLTSIGTTKKPEWDARRKESDPRQIGSFLKIATGFAKVWSYWDGMDSLSSSIEARSRNQYPFPAVERAIDIPAHLELSEKDIAAISSFTQQARQILSRRFDLGNVETVDRYYTLAGELVNASREDTSQWLDARAEVFNRLTQLIVYAGGEKNVRENSDHLWQRFTASDLSSFLEKPARTQPQRSWDYEPPTEPI
jgi:hypothetical protein